MTGDHGEVPRLDLAKKVARRLSWKAPKAWIDVRSGHGFGVIEDLVKVPLVLHGPGVPAAGRVGTAVRHVDLFPTLLGAGGGRRRSPRASGPRDVAAAAVRGRRRGPPRLQRGRRREDGRRRELAGLGPARRLEAGAAGGRRRRAGAVAPARRVGRRRRRQPRGRRADGGAAPRTSWPAPRSTGPAPSCRRRSRPRSRSTCAVSATSTESARTGGTLRHAGLRRPPVPGGRSAFPGRAPDRADVRAA